MSGDGRDNDAIEDETADVPALLDPEGDRELPADVPPAAVVQPKD